MQVIYGISKFKENLKKNILCIGVFDGVHLGHQHILKRLVSRAKERDSKSIVLTFYPNPDLQFLIYPLFYRLKLLKDIGVDCCVVVKFSKSLSKLEPEDFISKYIKGIIQPEEIIVGENFHFGKEAKGDVDLLSNYARRFNFRINSLSLKRVNSKVVSSTWIRELIRYGDLKRIKKLLNRDYSIFGKVIKGKSLGRILNYPTANISVFSPCSLPSGIYCVETNFASPQMYKKNYRDKRFFGVCYIGSKPTIIQDHSPKKKLRHIEVHLFNFKRNIYGKTLEIRFIKKIRNEKRFSNLEELKSNIERDIQKAKIFFCNLYHNIYPTNS
jgi:riboflavin kinase/FMN adenylyltransferase